MPITSMPSTCQRLVFLAAHGYHAVISCQPASRHWAFQGIETGVFVLLAAALIAVTAIAVARRDA